MKLQDITAERRKGYTEDGLPYDTWAVFLSFQDDAGKWDQLGVFIPCEDGSPEKAAEAFEKAAQTLRAGPNAKPRP